MDGVSCRARATKRAGVTVDLPEEMERKIVELFSEFHRLFVTDHLGLQQTNLQQHHIRLKEGAKP